ncbi:unnamed protein product [Sphenostylis stenocarpa]|uniref:Uncharacterized protein n=1 Tax=Sphenostylis stenocarpa TaxID=92480 RepID=A0AA86VCC3_9FABA|nr:unnamed protein product [Sphenostylis stenocarpa]
MVLSATAIGALLGLGTQMYSNALRKLPYMRHPWEHVVGMGLGAVFVNQLLKWEAQVEQDLDKMLEKAKAANERRYIVSKSSESVKQESAQVQLSKYFYPSRFISSMNRCHYSGPVTIPQQPSVPTYLEESFIILLSVLDVSFFSALIYGFVFLVTFHFRAFLRIMSLQQIHMQNEKF